MDLHPLITGQCQLWSLKLTVPLSPHYSWKHSNRKPEDNCLPDDREGSTRLGKEAQHTKEAISILLCHLSQSVPDLSWPGKVGHQSWHMTWWLSSRRLLKIFPSFFALGWFSVWQWSPEMPQPRHLHPVSPLRPVWTWRQGLPSG